MSKTRWWAPVGRLVDPPDAPSAVVRHGRDVLGQFPARAVRQSELPLEIQVRTLDKGAVLEPPQQLVGICGHEMRAHDTTIVAPARDPRAQLPWRAHRARADDQRDPWASALRMNN